MAEPGTGEGKPPGIKTEESRVIRLKHRSKFRSRINRAKDRLHTTTRDYWEAALPERTTVSSYEELLELVEDYPDNTLQVSTVVTEKARRHKLAYITKIDMLGLDPKIEPVTSYVEKSEIKTNDAEESTREFFKNSAVRTAIATINDLRIGSNNPNARVLFSVNHPQVRQYDTALELDQLALERLDQELIDKGAKVFELPDPTR